MASAAAATDQDRFLFTLAMSEVVTNIVQHGGDGATLRVEMDVLADELRARIWDTAAPAMIDWESIRLPDDDAESGRGLVLALSVLNELRHTRSYSLAGRQYMATAAAVFGPGTRRRKCGTVTGTTDVSGAVAITDGCAERLATRPDEQQGRCPSDSTEAGDCCADR